MLLGSLLGDHGFQRGPKELLVALGSGADDIDEQVSPGHGGDKAGVAGACGEAMEAFRVAAGCVGDVAAVARGGLVDAVGAVVGAHGLAQPAVAGTVRLFREPAETVSLIVLYLPGGGVKVAGACGQLSSTAIAAGGQTHRRTDEAVAPNQRLVAARAGAIGLDTMALSRREATRNGSAGAGLGYRA